MLGGAPSKHVVPQMNFMGDSITAARVDMAHS